MKHDRTLLDDATDDLAAPRRMPFAVLILGLVGGGLCALLALNTATAASEVKERQIDASNAALNDSQQQLSQEVAALQAPAELARRAAALGLVPADAPAFLRVNRSGSITVLGSPAPASNPAPAPTPSPTSTKTPATSTGATSSGATTGTTTSGATSSGASSAGAGSTGAGSSTTPAAPPSTPTVTLPGGPR